MIEYLIPYLSMMKHLDITLIGQKSGHTRPQWKYM